MTMQTPSRPTARRPPSAAWSRLRPAPTDPLERVGLPSKGDTSLNDFKAQEAYYQKITERWLDFCADAGKSEELDRRLAEFAALENEPSTPSTASTSTTKPTTSTPVATTGTTSSQPTKTLMPTTPRQPAKLQKPQISLPHRPAPPPSTPQTRPYITEASTLLLSMRKLREALTSTHRLDTFAQTSYTFIIRTCLLLRHWPSYQPALLHLLHTIHPVIPLSPYELREFIGYHILDLSCRLADYSGAYAVKARWNFDDMWKPGGVDRALHALVHDNWHMFWKVKSRCDGYNRALVRFAEGRVRGHALKCVGKSYFTVEKAFVESVGAMGWEGLVRDVGVGWELEEDTGRVTVRRMKVKETQTEDKGGVVNRKAASAG